MNKSNNNKKDNNNSNNSNSSSPTNTAAIHHHQSHTKHNNSSIVSALGRFFDRFSKTIGISGNSSGEIRSFEEIEDAFRGVIRDELNMMDVQPTYTTSLHLYIRVFFEDFYSPIGEYSIEEGKTDYSSSCEQNRIKRIIGYFLWFVLGDMHSLKQVLFYHFDIFPHHHHQMTNRADDASDSSLFDRASGLYDVTTHEKWFIIKLLLIMLGTVKESDVKQLMRETPLTVIQERDVAFQMEALLKNPILVNVLSEMKNSYAIELQSCRLGGLCSQGTSRRVYPQSMTLSQLDSADFMSNVDSYRVLEVLFKDGVNRMEEIALLGERHHDGTMIVSSKDSSVIHGNDDNEDDTDFLLRFQPNYELPLPDDLPLNEKEELFWLLPMDERCFHRNLQYNDFLWCDSSVAMPTLSSPYTPGMHKQSSADNVSTLSGSVNSGEISVVDPDETKWITLFSNSFSLQLKPVEQSFVIQHIEQYLSNTNFLTPNKLSDLVMNNSIIAANVLKYYIKTDNPGIDDYLSVLSNMQPVCIQSMEVINSLLEVDSEAVDMKYYLGFYIHNGICSCDRMSSDVSMQKRLVRILSVFLKSLIQRQILDVSSNKFEDLILQIRTFCIQYSKMREASDLFRLLGPSKK